MTPIRARLMTSLFLFDGDEVLLLHRMGSRAVPNSWVGIGGHIEGAEIDDPQASLLREVAEEIGLSAQDLTGLSLRYVSTRSTGTEIRTTYYFTAQLRPGVPRPTTCDEGELRWFDEGELRTLPMPPTAAAALRHCLDHPVEDGRLHAVVATPQGCQVLPLADDGASLVAFGG